jgi:hypothetical protein
MTNDIHAPIAAGLLLSAITGWEMYQCHREGATRQSRRWTRRGIVSQWLPKTRNPGRYQWNMALLGFFTMAGIILAIWGAIFPEWVH